MNSGSKPVYGEPPHEEGIHLYGMLLPNSGKVRMIPIHHS